MISELSIFYSIRLKILSSLVSIIVLTNIFSSAAISADFPAKTNIEVHDFFNVSQYIGLILDNVDDPLPPALYQNHNELVGWKFVSGEFVQNQKQQMISNKLFLELFIDKSQKNLILLVEETGRSKIVEKYRRSELIIRDAIGFRAGIETSFQYPDDLKLCPKVSKSGDQVLFIGNERPLKNKRGAIEGYELKPVRYAWSLDRAAKRFIRTSVDGIHCRAYLDI